MSNQPAMRGYVVGPGEGVPDRTPDVKASGRSTGGSLTVMELTVEGGPPRHTHTREDESLYVFTGVAQSDRARRAVRGWGSRGRGFKSRRPDLVSASQSLYTRCETRL